MNGRHFILLGLVACAGLLSVHDGQKQVELCYLIGALEQDLRDVRAQVQLYKIQHRALQSPRAVTERASQLQLKVGPIVPPAAEVVRETRPPAPDTSRTLGAAQGARPMSVTVRAPSPVRTARPHP
jgi:hypothetical protein